MATTNIYLFLLFIFHKVDLHVIGLICFYKKNKTYLTESESCVGGFSLGAAQIASNTQGQTISCEPL